MKLFLSFVVIWCLGFPNFSQEATKFPGINTAENQKKNDTEGITMPWMLLPSCKLQRVEFVNETGGSALRFLERKINENFLSFEFSKMRWKIKLSCINGHDAKIINFSSMDTNAQKCLSEIGNTINFNITFMNITK